MITVEQKIAVLEKLRDRCTDHERYILNCIIDDDLKFQIPDKEPSYIRTIFGRRRA